MSYKLDIIVPHYKEPPELFFNMIRILDMQRGIQAGDVRVSIVHDGTGFDATHPHLENMEIRELTVPHGGVSAARNAGLRASDAEWIMWCDFDDAFVSTTALWEYLSMARRRPEANLITGAFYQDRVLPNGSRHYYVHDGSDRVFIHGKMFRRKWLLDNDVWFDEKLTLHEDSYFMALARALLGSGEVAKIPYPLYVWQHNPGSLTREDGDFVLRTFDHWAKRCLALYEELMRRCMFIVMKDYACGHLCEAAVNFWRVPWQEECNVEWYQKALRTFHGYLLQADEILLAIDIQKIHRSLESFLGLYAKAGEVDGTLRPEQVIWRDGETMYIKAGPRYRFDLTKGAVTL